MHVFIANLHEDGPRVRQQIARHGQPVTQIGKVGMNAVTPSIAKSLDLLRFAGDVVGLTVLHVAAGG
ncbi:hypothetical protein FQZ97_1096080 [compost metagenome]